MTATEAQAQALAEGLTLARADSQSGFRSVTVLPVKAKGQPRHQARVSRDGREVSLGCFATAEEAALHVARTPEAKARMARAQTNALAYECVLDSSVDWLGQSSSGLPDGWVCSTHAAPSGPYKRYEGPNGEKAQSLKQAWQSSVSQREPEGAGRVRGSLAPVVLMDAAPTAKDCTRDTRCPRAVGHRGHCKLKGEEEEDDPPPAPAAQVVNKMPVKKVCCTPGCEQKDFHLGPCDERQPAAELEMGENALLPISLTKPSRKRSEGGEALATADRTATEPPAAIEARVSVAASEAGSGSWAEVEVTAEDLVNEHPRSFELVGADVCVMAAAYPTDTLTCSGAVGWRGTVTHTRGSSSGSDGWRVRVLGSWFRLADETLLRPIKQVASWLAAAQATAAKGAVAKGAAAKGTVAQGTVATHHAEDSALPDAVCPMSEPGRHGRGAAAPMPRREAAAKVAVEATAEAMGGAAEAKAEAKATAETKAVAKANAKAQAEAKVEAKAAVKAAAKAEAAAWTQEVRDGRLGLHAKAVAEAAAEAAERAAAEVTARLRFHSLDGEVEGEDAHAKVQRRGERDGELMWTPELHARFEAAVSTLGLDAAKPKSILRLMHSEGYRELTRQNISSHLQHYRAKRQEHAPCATELQEQEEGEEQTGAAKAAVRQAEAEGLTLQKADSVTGYRHVVMNRNSETKPFKANVRRDNKQVYLGSFATPEEAALAVARTPEAQAQVASRKLAPVRPSTKGAGGEEDEEDEEGEEEEEKGEEMELTGAAKAAARAAAHQARLLRLATAASASRTTATATSTSTAISRELEAGAELELEYGQCGTFGCTLEDFHAGLCAASEYGHSECSYRKYSKHATGLPHPRLQPHVSRLQPHACRCIGQSVAGPRRRRMPAFLQEAAEEVWEDHSRFEDSPSPPAGRGEAKTQAAPRLPLTGAAQACEQSGDTESAAPQHALSSIASEEVWAKRRRRGGGDAAAEEWAEDWVQCSSYNPNLNLNPNPNPNHDPNPNPNPTQVQCSSCAKWRRGISGVSAHAYWQCSFSNDEGYNRCSRPEEGLAAKAAPWYDTYYQVECITDERLVEGRSEFRVQWSGFGPEDDTWELAAADGGSLDAKLVGE